MHFYFSYIIYLIQFFLFLFSSFVLNFFYKHLLSFKYFYLIKLYLINIK